jgi:hypothetical protein
VTLWQARRPTRPGASVGMGQLPGPQRVRPLWSPFEQWSFPFSISFSLNQIQLKIKFDSNPINFGSNFGI